MTSPSDFACRVAALATAGDVLALEYLRLAEENERLRAVCETVAGWIGREVPTPAVREVLYAARDAVAGAAQPQPTEPT